MRTEAHHKSLQTKPSPLIELKGGKEECGEKRRQSLNFSPRFFKAKNSVKAFLSRRRIDLSDAFQGCMQPRTSCEAHRPSCHVRWRQLNNLCCECIANTSSVLALYEFAGVQYALSQSSPCRPCEGIWEPSRFERPLMACHSLHCRIV